MKTRQLKENIVYESKGYYYKNGWIRTYKEGSRRYDRASKRPKEFKINYSIGKEKDKLTIPNGG